MAAFGLLYPADVFGTISWIVCWPLSSTWKAAQSMGMESLFVSSVLVAVSIVLPRIESTCRQLRTNTWLFDGVEHTPVDVEQLRDAGTVAAQGLRLPAFPTLGKENV